MVGLPQLGVSVPLPFLVGAGLMALCFLLALRLLRRRIADAS